MGKGHPGGQHQGGLRHSCWTPRVRSGSFTSPKELQRFAECPLCFHQRLNLCINETSRSATCRHRRSGIRLREKGVSLTIRLMMNKTTSKTAVTLHPFGREDFSRLISWLPTEADLVEWCAAFFDTH